MIVRASEKRPADPRVAQSGKALLRPSLDELCRRDSRSVCLRMRSGFSDLRRHLGGSQYPIVTDEAIVAASFHR